MAVGDVIGIWAGKFLEGGRVAWGVDFALNPLALVELELRFVEGDELMH